jgi:hypothetical protein
VCGSLELPLANMYLRYHSVPRTSLLEQVEKCSARAYVFYVTLAHFIELNAGYSPIRDVQLAEWSKEAIARENQRKLAADGDDLVTKSEAGLLVSSRAHPGPVGRGGDNDKGASQ